MDVYFQADATGLLVFVLVLLVMYLYMRPNVHLPPGPTSLPVLGSIGFLWTLSKRLPHKAFAEESRKHGGIISIWVGPELFVILNGYDTIRKAFVDQSMDFLDRPNWLPQFRKDLQSGKGISWSNGEEWKVVRKFTLKALRRFGVGKRTTEGKIMAEVQELCTIFKIQKNEPFSVNKLMQYAVSNVICSFIFGKRFEYDDEVLLEFLKNIDFAVSGAGFTTVTNFLPECLHPLFPKEYKILMKKRQSSQRVNELLDYFIEEHRNTFDKSDIRDFIDLYLQVDSEGTADSQNTYLTAGNMHRVILDLFIAGSETTATALDWAFLYMIEYPHIQTKCRQAIWQNVGKRPVTLSDRDALVYIVATIQEVLRLSNVVPLGVPRTCADRDIVIDGFTIPKRTMILANLYSANVDPKYWNDPQVFNPDRFLDQSGYLINNEAFVPLSLGPRVCAGEKLAKEELFLVFSNLVQQFEFKRADESVGHDFSTKPGQFITLSPKPYKLRVCDINTSLATKTL